MALRWDSQLQPRPFCQGPDMKPHFPNSAHSLPQNEVWRGLDPGQIPGFKTWVFFSTFSQCYLKEPHRLPEVTSFETGEDHENCFVGQRRPIKALGTQWVLKKCPVVMLDHRTGSCNLLKGILDPGTSRGSVSDPMTSVTVWF